MLFEKNPLTPHLQVYRWNISSLLSITHRIVGVVNIIAISIICFWVIFLFFGSSDYQAIKFFLNTFFGKFLIITLCWTFSFHILNEIRHLVWDIGYGFNLKTSKISGALAFFGSFILTTIFYLLGKGFL